MSGVLCDKKLSARVKGKMYRSVVRPAMLYGMKTVAVRERQLEKMEVSELKKERFHPQFEKYFNNFVSRKQCHILEIANANAQYIL